MLWLPILLPTIPGFVGSGVGSAVVTHWLTIKRTGQELLRAKLEELFLAVSSYGIQVFNMTAPYLQAMRGKLMTRPATYQKGLRPGLASL
jgi:hypothetical protein